jgi:predicted DNA-binding transcriptional regulator YafY
LIPLSRSGATPFLYTENMGRGDNKLELIKLLREQPGLTAAQIGERLGIHYRSVYRVVENCLQIGYSIVHENGCFHLRSKDRDHARIEFTLTGQQAHDLVAAAKSVRVLTPHAQEALETIRDHLVGSNLERESAVYYHSYDRIDPSIYRALVSATQSRQALDLVYLPAREGRDSTEHVFDPYKIIFWNGHYYLVGCSRAYSHKPSGGVMHLRLDRIGEARVAMRTPEGKSYKEPLTFPKPDFDPQAYVEQSFGPFGGQGEPVDIALRFPSESAKAAAEVQRHPSRVLEWQTDGSLIYRLSVPTSQEIVWWIASWVGARVLEPESLREQVRAHALEVARANE